MSDERNIEESKVGSLARKAIECKETADKMELQIKGYRKMQQEALDELLAIMDLQGMQSFKAQGHTFYIEERESVSVPKSAEERKKLFGYLESLGILDDYLTINSQSLNSLFKSLSEAALEKGDIDFALPGVGEPSSFKKVKIRKA